MYEYQEETRNSINVAIREIERNLEYGGVPPVRKIVELVALIILLREDEVHKKENELLERAKKWHYESIHEEVTGIASDFITKFKLIGEEQ
jgi:hypothetical protein